MNLRMEETTSTLSERAYRTLREDIVAGKLAPGEKLKIAMLRERYSLGAGPLREALARLSGEHLVILEGQRGFAVAPISTDEAQDIGRLRIHLEMEAIRATLPLMDNTWENRLIAAYHRLARYECTNDHDEQETKEWEKLNTAFHDATVWGCPLHWTMKLREQILHLHERYRRISRTATIGHRDIAKEHEALFEAIMARDIEKCEAILTEHINRTTQHMAAVESI